MTRKGLYLALTAALLITPLKSVIAQKIDNNFQVSFVYPLGTLGDNSTNYSNKFSLNILGGVNGGVDGAELGGLFNIDSGDVLGFQAAGVFNLNSESLSGFQAAGVFNMNRSNSNGFQAAGVANINSDNTEGVVISGVANILSETTSGCAIAGAINYAESLDGVQVGTVNIAQNITGVQVGIINISKDIKGVQVGLLSFTKNGYFAVEASYNEVIYSNLTYKMGTEKLYNIYGVGLSSLNGESTGAFKYGFGTLINLNSSNRVAFEATSSYIIHEAQYGVLNLLNRGEISYQFNLAKRLSIHIGPAINVYLSEDREHGETGVLDVPYTIWSERRGTVDTFIWIGGSAGLIVNI